MEKVFDIYIRATPEEVWEAVTTRQGDYSFPIPEEMQGEFAAGGRVEEDPPRRLVQTMKANWSKEVAQEPESTITTEIEPWNDGMTHVRVTHSGLREGGSAEIWGGWPMILSSLKSLLETGESLNLRIPDEVVERWRAEKATA